MAQILTGQTPSQMMGQRITDPIAQSLQRLTQMQLNNISKQRERSNMMAGLSTLMSPEQAELFSYLPKYMQFASLSRKGGAGGKLTSARTKAFLKDAKGDVNLARMIAKESGYTF